MSFDLIAPWALLFSLPILAFVVDRLARRRRGGNDSADFWTRIVAWFLFPLGALLLVSRFLASFPGWPRGWHLYLDSVAGAPPGAFWLALLVPVLGWGVALAAALRAAPAPPGNARWLAGGLGFRNSRRWLAGFALPLLLIALFQANGLGGGAAAYPAALWSTLVIAATTLAALTFGGAPPPLAAPAAAAPGPEPATPARDWKEWLEASGIRARTLATWPASEPPRSPRGERARDLARQFDSAGARGVAPELVEALSLLLDSRSGADRPGPIRLVFAPDDCGQAEMVAVAANCLGRREQTITLVVTADDAAHLAARLQRWIPAEDRDRIAVLESGGLPLDALLWVCAAEFLSDRLLPLLKETRIARRIGLLVWWDLQDYSGVMAANLWAITRRLYRLLSFQGRHDIRTLALVRASGADAQLGNFVRHVLPHPLSPETETHVERRFRHPVILHRLEAGSPDPAGSARGQRLLLRAAAASAAGGWATFLEPPEDISGTELARFRQTSADGATLGDRLRSFPAEAEARLLEIGAAEVLALPERVCQGGRAGDSAPHHVGLVAPANPYAAHLLARLAQGRDVPGARRLVGAEASPAIIQRHLLLALGELPDTRRGLLQTTLWDEARVAEILNGLRQAGQLSRREVRYLDESGRLMRDWEYLSLRPSAGLFCPLDTVGLRLIEVRERAGDADDGGVRLRVDPERVLIKAYPGRVFMGRGRRYRVREWSRREILERGWLECQKDDQAHSTWRIRNSVVFRVRPAEGKAAAIGRAGRLTRRAVQLRYEEEVIGRIECLPDSPPGTEPRKTYLDRPLAESFDTRALILRLLDRTPEANALVSLSLALRCVLPVHLGVEDDALEVVVLSGDMIDREETHGLAIVDLYPGGIGLIDAIQDDNAFLLNLLQWTRDWLKACSAPDLQTPALLAANGDYPFDRAAALKLLEGIV